MPEPTLLSTANTGTSEGQIPLLGASGKLSSGVLPALALTSTLAVANAAARLALTSAQAQGKIVIEADTGKSYGLVTGGNPATSGDWLQVGDRDITATDISNSTAAGRALLTAADAAAQRTALSLGTAATLNSSQLGGVNFVAQFGSNGDLVTGAFENDNVIMNPGGNITFPDKRGIQWLTRAGGDSGAQIYMWEDHDIYGGELILESPNRIALVQGIYGAIQIGLSRSVGTPSFTYMQVRHPATASVQGDSQPFYFNASHWNGSTAVGATSLMSIQGRARATDGHSELVIGTSSGLPGNLINSDAVRSEVVAFTPEGMRDVTGNAPAFVTATDGATVTLTCSTVKAFQHHAVTLAGNRTLAFSGATAGQRGTILVSQDSVGSRTLTLPANSAYRSAITLSTAAYKTDRLEWVYDGAYFYFELFADYTLPFDADAVTFLSAASISQASTEGVALNRLVLDLKQYDLWTSAIIEAYPLIGGTSGKHAYGLKRAGYDATFGSTVTHNTTGITGAALNTDWMDTGINVSALGLRDNIGIYAYNRTTTLTASGRMFGTNIANGRFYVTKSSSRQFGAGPCSANLNTISSVADAVTDAGHYWFGRTSSATIAIAADADWTTATDTANAAPTAGIAFLAMNDGTGSSTRGANSTNANLAFAAVTRGLTQTQYNNLRTCVTAFQTALGRAI